MTIRKRLDRHRSIARREIRGTRSMAECFEVGLVQKRAHGSSDPGEV